MIYDVVKNASKYKGLSKELDTALDFITNTNIKELECGRIDIDGEQVFANVMEYMTKLPSEGFFESHKKYIDIHMLITGEERVSVTDIDKVTDLSEYSEVDDFQKHEAKVYSDSLITEDCFMICFPQDAHRPGMAIEDKQEVKKIVLKIKA